jgi:hypothetical protein
MKYRVSFLSHVEVEGDSPQGATDTVKEMVPGFIMPYSFFKPMVLPLSRTIGIRKSGRSKAVTVPALSVVR